MTWEGISLPALMCGEAKVDVADPVDNMDGRVREVRRSRTAWRGPGKTDA
jgi:delta-aminolevulinic acid dehydratase/porphobilinogen synthase